MSCLLLDLGNTRCKLALSTRGDLGATANVRYADQAALQSYLREHVRAGMPALASQVVAEDAGLDVLSAVESAIGRPVRRILSTDPVPGIRNGYRRPDQLGVDRLLGMVAARAACKGAFCVVDVGTAVTIDLVDSRGNHQGGLILPGERLARECLLAQTSIPDDGEIDADARLGRDTATAVALGARYAVASTIERIVSSHQDLTGEDIGIIVGGGGSDALLAYLPPGSARLRELVLHGLAVFAASEGL
jgi:type III pantothenate kinase